ncbi:MAG TPA: PorV/PorQ family protein [Candidatus Marinimicrobia bacterium]|nr:PorV/PorQ family protein [Candidatus Neomarinimicrobiota bacterium]
MKKISAYKKRSSISLSVAISILTVFSLLSAQEPYRVGTTAANFLELGVGSAGISMGEAYVAAARDLSAIYWNPAGLAYMEKNEVQVMYQPWIADINNAFASVAIVLPRVGTLAAGITTFNYGEEEVTTLAMQDGTGETYTANELAATLSFSRKLAAWFSFGASAKLISSSIWHMSASAAAVDLGVVVNTHFLTFGGDREDGLSIGMSIANYGSRIKYDGIDLLNPIDIKPNENGNYADVQGQFRMQAWELPLIFRIGIALHPIHTSMHRLTLALDALHPNNNSESVNLGAEYSLTFPGSAAVYLRGGYRGLFMDQSQFGATFGGGLNLLLLNNAALKFDYAWRNVGLFGNRPAYTISIHF